MTRSELSSDAPCHDVGQVLLRVVIPMVRSVEKGIHIVERVMASHVVVPW